MKTTKSWIAAAGLIAALVPDSRAGTVLVVDSETYTAPKSQGTATVYMEKRRMRIDSTEGGKEMTVIYTLNPKDEPHYVLIDRRASTYVEVTFADMKRIRAQVEKSREELDRQIKSLTPERKRQMQKLYRRPLDELAKEPTHAEYHKVATGARVGEWVCDQYQGNQEGEKVEEVWAASWKALGIARGDLAIFGDMADMFEGSGQKLPAFFSFAREGVTGVEGFPVMVVAYQEGNPVEKSRVREVRRERIDPQLFELPEGLTRQNIGQQR
jgi:hypothetical protein